jgi:hypothetical protein
LIAISFYNFSIMHSLSNMALAALLLTTGATAAPAKTTFANVALPFPRGLDAADCPQQLTAPPPRHPFQAFDVSGTSRLPGVDVTRQPQIFANGLNALSFVKATPVPPPAPDAPQVRCELITKFKWDNTKKAPMLSTSWHFLPGQRYVMTFATTRVVTKAAMMMLHDINTRYVWDSTFPANEFQAPGSGPAGWVEFEVLKETDFSFALEAEKPLTSGQMALFTLGPLR